MIKMDNIVTVYFTSDCCGCEMTFAQTDYGICPQCCEHCEVIGEEVFLDNGEY
jgi:predicted amidophosphoribosyltransferase